MNNQYSNSSLFSEGLLANENSSLQSYCSSRNQYPNSIEFDKLDHNLFEIKFEQDENKQDLYDVLATDIETSCLLDILFRYIEDFNVREH